MSPPEKNENRCSMNWLITKGMGPKFQFITAGLGGPLSQFYALQTRPMSHRSGVKTRRPLYADETVIIASLVEVNGNFVNSRLVTIRRASILKPIVARATIQTHSIPTVIANLKR